MLHTLIKSPFEIDFLSLMRMIKISDAFLALQDGVLIAITGNIFLKKIILSTPQLYVMREDVYARGLFSNISSSFLLISYADFVDLTVQHKQQMSW